MLRQCKVSFSPVGKKEQFVAVSRASVALSPTHCELCHSRLPEPPNWGIISASVAHIRWTCWVDLMWAAPLCPSIHPSPFPSSCWASSFNHFLLPCLPSPVHTKLSLMFAVLSASPNTFASLTPCRAPCHCPLSSNPSFSHYWHPPFLPLPTPNTLTSLGCAYLSPPSPSQVPSLQPLHFFF